MTVFYLLLIRVPSVSICGWTSFLERLMRTGIGRISAVVRSAKTSAATDYTDGTDEENDEIPAFATDYADDTDEENDERNGSPPRWRMKVERVSPARRSCSEGGSTRCQRVAPKAFGV
jgi:hypothetical protein